MVSDATTMTIRVGTSVFKEPDLARRAEWDFDFKAAICGYPEGARDQKAWHKFYAEMLGCRFNFRFFAANYHLWIGNRMTERTGNMLRFEGKHWRAYNSRLVAEAHKVLPYINEAERDGLYNIIPPIIAFGAPPHGIRGIIGRGAWRRVANNSLSRNLLIMNALYRREPQYRAKMLLRLLEMPSGVMRAVGRADDDEVIAARITPKKRVVEFQHTVHLVRDTRGMMSRDDFNPLWGYARMRQEHEKATKAIMQRRYSDKQFAESWAFQRDGYSATLLTSQADIATEGAVQHHCVASYAYRAAGGDYAVFRIEGKERATAGIIKGRVDQVYGACNGHVSDECRDFTHKLAAAYLASTRKMLEAA